jgi:hypothetical protein
MTMSKSTITQFSVSQTLCRSVLALLILSPLPVQSSPLFPQWTAILSPFFDRATSTPICKSDTAMTQTTATPTQPQHGLELLKRQGTWSLYTSLLTTAQTETFTSIGSVYVASETCTPNWADGQLPCGPKCCDQNWYCANFNQGICLYDSTGATTTGGVPGAGGTGTVGTRPTTISGVVTVVTVSPTVTTTFGTAVATGSTQSPVPSKHHGGLSGGAIAGIVIGVLFGIGLLMLLCFCCCVDWLLHVFGIRKRRSRAGSRRTTVVEEEEIRRHSNGRWYGSAAGGSRYSRRSRPPPKKSNNAGWLGALGAGAATAGLFGMFKKKEETRVKKENESYTTYSDYSYYTYGK